MENYMPFFWQHFMSYLEISLGLFIPITIFSILILIMFFRKNKGRK